MTDLVADVIRHPVPFALGGLGLATGFVLFACSTGTEDIRTWEAFARAIRAGGLLGLYARTPSFNHPPLMGLLAWASLELSSRFGIPFAVVFKLFPVLANAAGTVTLWALWRERSDTRTGALAFALSAWAPCPMLVGAYHGNTDCLCASLCLLSCYLLAVRRTPFLGGVALAAAVNVKVIPLLLVPPIVAGFRSWRELRRFALGSATAALPLLLAVAGAGTVVLRNIFGYGSEPAPWGVAMVLLLLQKVPGLGEQALAAVSRWYLFNGRWVVVAAVIALAAYGRWRRLDHQRLMAAGLVLFLLLAPGFGVQYTVYPVFLMLAVSLAWGMAYSVVAGLFIGSVYAAWSLDMFPLESVYRGFDLRLSLLGFAAWLVLAAFLPTCLRPPRQDREASP